MLTTAPGTTLLTLTIYEGQDHTDGWVFTLTGNGQHDHLFTIVNNEVRVGNEYVPPGVKHLKISSVHPIFGTFINDFNIKIDDVYLRYTPEVEDTLEGWFDASDVSTIVAINNSVLSIDGKSDNGLVLNSNGQPETDVRTINGLNVIAHSGGSYLYTNNVSMPASGNLSVFFVGLVDQRNSFNDGLFSFDASTNDFSVNTTFNSVDKLYLRTDLSPTSDTDYNGISPFVGPAIVEVVLDWDNNLIHGYYNGIDKTGPVVYTKKLTASTVLELFKGAYSSPDGVWGEFIFLDTADVSRRQKMEGYLAHKWGLVEDLDPTHPYKSDVPRVVPSGNLSLDTSSLLPSLSGSTYEILVSYKHLTDDLLNIVDVDVLTINDSVAFKHKSDNTLEIQLYSQGLSYLVSPPPPGQGYGGFDDWFTLRIVREDRGSGLKTYYELNGYEIVAYSTDPLVDILKLEPPRVSAGENEVPLATTNISVVVNGVTYIQEEFKYDTGVFEETL